MIIYPKCKNLNTAIKCCSAVGIFPSQFMFPKNKKMRSVYDIYSFTILGYWIGYIVTAYIALFFILNESPIRKDLMSLNLCITLMYTVTFHRLFIMQVSTSFKKMIETIIKDEAKGDLVDDELIQKRDKESIEDADWRFWTYICFVAVVCFLYLLKPIMVGLIEETHGNVTRLVRELPISSWFPFDVQEHYKIAYTFQSTICLVGGSIVVFTDILMISLILYPCRRLRKLDYLLKNFQNFSRKYQILNAIEDEEKAAVLFFKYLIDKHESIITFVDIYNRNMAYPMVFDFIQSSVQIASVLTQVSGNEITFMLISSIALFWISMVLRLFLYYYYANELLNLSQKLTYSIWESNWPDETPKIKFMVLIFIMRAQKPLAFRIGPFSQMSVESLISVLKATYSYVMLILA